MSTIVLLQCLNFCRCDYDHWDCVKAEWYVGEICNKVAFKRCCIDNQEEFGFCYNCYAQPGHHAGYSIEYLEGMLAKVESGWCQGKTYNYTTPTGCSVNKYTLLLTFSSAGQHTSASVSISKEAHTPGASNKGLGDPIRQFWGTLEPIF